MKNMMRWTSVCLLVLSFAGQSLAITWFPKEFTCPIDSEKNTFYVVGSYGSYIYSYPSKYQWLFFPHTDSPTYYLCKKCHLATFMWDFDSLPKEKLADIKTVLATVKVSKPFKEYQEIPITERVEIMEKIYTVLGKDQEWWEQFYRIKGYHYGKAGDSQKAAENRRKSLDKVQKMLADNKDGSSKKLLLYVSGSMKHFLEDDKGAIQDLEKALSTKYAAKGATAEELKDGEEGLNERIRDYIARIKSEKDKPRLFDRSGADQH